MKRSPVLQPLSREHHTALTLAKASESAARSGDEDLVRLVCQRVIRAYANELEPHFQFEEVSLLPLRSSTAAQPLVERTLADHQLLRGLLDALRQNDTGAMDSFGKCLTAHVRFEERVLFAEFESLLLRE